MSFLADVARRFLGDLPPDDIAARSAPYEYPSFEEQMSEVWARHNRRTTWRTASVDDALSVPAIFEAVSLIAGSMGTLTMDAYRNQQRVASEDRPRLVVRPNPFTKPYTFWFLSAFYKATRGERWWWVAARDPIDRTPLSLFPVPPWEITVDVNDDNRLRPTIKWADRVIPNEDMIADFWFPDHSGLRGIGPLQKAGAAVSVAVEAEQWAANFFTGSIPSMIGTTEQDMTEDELKALDRQWMEKPGNLPRWLTNGVTMTESPFDPTRAQLNESRQFNVGDVARMFSIPGSLLEYQMSGSSLTYRNDEGIWTDFQRRCLGPIFAEPMEQDMSDLLPRTYTAQFDFDRMLRADVKTRFESYKTGIEAGFLTPEEARQKEGLEPGSSEFAPVPFSAPQAVPTLLPPNRELPVARTALEDVRCPKCGKLAGRVSGAAEIRCQRCRTMVTVAGLQVRAAAPSPPAPPAPNVTVTVNPPSTTFEAGAFQVAAPDMAPMTALAGSITELAARPVPNNEITVQPAEVHIDEGAVRVEFTPSPVTVEAPQVTVEPPNVTVNLPDPKPTTKRIERDGNDNILRIVEESA